MPTARKLVALGLLAALVAVAGCSQASDGGAGATPTETDAADDETATATATASATETPTETPTSTATATPTVSPTPVPTETVSGTAPEELGVDFEITNTEECSRTCRDVTYVVSDTSGDGVQDVSANITIRSDGEFIWNKQESVGDISANGSVEQTVRIDLEAEKAFIVYDNDNQVTLTAELHADGQTTTIVQQRQF